MATGSAIISSLNNASAPISGTPENTQISFGGAQVLQAVSNLYLEVILADPTNTGPDASFEVQIVGGIGTINSQIGTAITAKGLVSVESSSPITTWQANLVSLSGGVAPTVTVRGVAGE
jgi:hypothetical protein